MRQFSAALLTRAMGPVKAFFSSPCGRHSAAVAGRRRRSTRVRRYAPAPAAPARASAAQPLPERPALPDIPAPRLAPPPERLPADDIALVRPYYAFHERELARTQAEATALPHRWIPRPRPTGDLLTDPAPAPAPPPHSPPREWDELAALTRLWITQQDQRQRQAVPA